MKRNWVSLFWSWPIVPVRHR